MLCGDRVRFSSDSRMPRDILPVAKDSSMQGTALSERSRIRLPTEARSTVDARCRQFPAGRSSTRRRYSSGRHLDPANPGFLFLHSIVISPFSDDRRNGTNSNGGLHSIARASPSSRLFATLVIHPAHRVRRDLPSELDPMYPSICVDERSGSGQKRARICDSQEDPLLPSLEFP